MLNKDRDTPSQPDHHLDALRGALTPDLPPCTAGVFPVDSRDLVLYFGKEEINNGRISFSSPSEESLKRLSDICDAATFGVNAESVLDETYRKAGKLDSEYFAAKFDPASTGLLDKLRDVLLVGHDDDVSIRAELYKLNVYGPGSFFKAHKDTPRGDGMFASLVIIYPTAHQGGALRFRHGTLDYTFDSAAEVSQATAPSIAFAAFFSDVDHEVSMVESGYRVTLTYNLYYGSAREPRRINNYVAETQESALRAAFAAILSDATYLPNGGYIGFGLSHQYPTATLDVETLSELKALKGKDAVLMKVCRELGLEVEVKVVYEYIDDIGEGVVCDAPIRGDDYIHPDMMQEELDYVGGRLLKMNRWDDEPPIPMIHIKWAVPLAPQSNRVRTAWVSYGNEPCFDYSYATFCFLVEIAPPSERPGGEAQTPVDAGN